ncbi:restriction endonuclease [Labrenzia sp. CP4]|jgi:HJR/Mrr/RecB family endonuclease/DNA-binding transcriptional regulator/RsmH inhibitor MraZ|uniref:restriction endonuclease n=1 Tax=Labrenzia sp. CP4 TaxID=1674922 RepID=UPI000A5D78B7|nr:restriction endonuclease [Labrenzia sp. CP4]
MTRRFQGNHLEKLGEKNTLPVPDAFRRVIDNKPLVVHPSFRNFSVRFLRKDVVNHDLLAKLMEETGLNNSRLQRLLSRLPAEVLLNENSFTFPQAFMKFLAAFFNIENEVHLTARGDFFEATDKTTSQLRHEALSEICAQNLPDDFDPSELVGNFGEVNNETLESLSNTDVSDAYETLDACVDQYSIAALVNDEKSAELCRSAQKKILESAALDPTSLFKMSSRNFEKLVYSVFSELGCDCELTASSSDGGFDVFVRAKGVLGTQAQIFECKRFGPDRPVGVEIVRSLLGTVTKDLCNGATLVTTSTFTSGANALQSSNSYILNLMDYGQLMKCVFKAVGPLDKAVHS